MDYYSTLEDNFGKDNNDFDYLSVLLPDTEKTLLFLDWNDEHTFHEVDGLEDGKIIFFFHSLFLLICVLIGCLFSYMLYSWRVSRLQVIHVVEK
jgi:hypothetical protein